MYLDLLQADHIRLMLVDDGLQLVQAGAQAIDIERDDLHVRDAHVIFISGYWTRNPPWMQVKARGHIRGGPPAAAGSAGHLLDKHHHKQRQREAAGEGLEGGKEP